MIKILNFLLILVVFVFFIIIFLRFNNKPNVIINQHKFMVDVAETDGQKARGLDIYDKLPLEKGMIFPFKTDGKYSFWMKGMKFPIDIIYIKNDKIAEIFSNIPNPKTSTETPAIVTPHENINYVLEINAGLSRRYNFKVGGKANINL